MRDRLIFGIRDVKVRERLLRESQLTLISRYTSQIIALLAVNYAATVVDLTILQPFVEVESAETQKKNTSVKAIDQETNHGDDSDEIYMISEFAVVTLDDIQLVTLGLESGNYLRFQPDTGAQCNVIPVHLYKKAVNDPDLKH